MNYSELKLLKNIDTVEMDWDGKKIKIIKYLPIEDKYDIVMITLQKAFENGIYNPIKLDIFFHLNLIYMYTNLVFTEEEKENETKLYDEMESSGFMDKFLTYIDTVDYTEMQEDIDNIAELLMNYNTTAASMFRSFIEDLPANAEAAQSIVENFNPEKYKAVIDFAKAANGGRAIENK